MIETDLQELSWDDIPVAYDSTELPAQDLETDNSVTFSISALAQEIQVDIANSYSNWVNVENTLSASLAYACLCHASTNISSDYGISSTSSIQLSSFLQSPMQLESHEGHSCDECGGSIQNGKCSKCGHAHHH